MAPKSKISKQDILTASIDIIRMQGVDALNARTLATHMGCSTQPIFSNYSSMEHLKHEITKAAHDLYLEYIRTEIDKKQCPEYKAMGIAYIRFAKEESELFKLLFMCERSDNATILPEQSYNDSVSIILNNNPFSLDEANQFHAKMWIFVHGIATMMATSFLSLDWDTISTMLSEAYQGFRQYHVSEEELK